MAKRTIVFGGFQLLCHFNLDMMYLIIYLFYSWNEKWSKSQTQTLAMMQNNKILTTFFHKIIWAVKSSDRKYQIIGVNIWDFCLYKHVLHNYITTVVSVPLASWDTTAATRVPRLRIGERPRMDKRVAPDKEGAADKQCLRRRKTLIPNRGRWSSLSLFRQIHLGERKLWFQTGADGARLASLGKSI